LAGVLALVIAFAYLLVIGFLSELLPMAWYMLAWV
jgi:hypothetical protein